MVIRFPRLSLVPARGRVGTLSCLLLVALAAPAGAAASPRNCFGALAFSGDRVESLAVAAAGEPSRLYAVVDSRLHVSSDGGASWSPLDTPPTATIDRSLVDALATHPWRPGLLVVGLSSHLARSTDGGESFQELGTGCLRPREFAFGTSDPDRYYVSGLDRFGGECFPTPPDACRLYRGDGAEPLVCISGAPGPVAASALAVDPRDADRLLAAEGAHVFRSEDGGVTWTEVADGFVARVFRLHPGDPDVVWAGTVGQGVWRSEDFGSTWARADEGGSVDLIWDLEVDPVDPSVLHAIVDEGRAVWTSGEGGITWRPLISQLPGSDPYFSDIELDPADPSVLLQGNDDGFYCSELSDRHPCYPDDGTLCLLGLGGRVRVQVGWRAYDGSSGLGHAVEETSESGWFWFFDEDNPELVVKVLDGRPVNGELWVFYGSLTSVELTIKATDTESGEVVSFHNPLHRFASAGHTAPFGATRFLRPTGGSVATEPRWSPPLALPARAGAACAAPGGLCLHDRFRVTVEWEDFFGNAGAGVPLPLTADAGFFWFFEPGNLELVVKVLDAEPVNGHWWVFYGALTNVAYRLRVEDTLTGAERVYDNPLHHFGSRGDTAAFPAGATPANGAP